MAILFGSHEVSDLNKFMAAIKEGGPPAEGEQGEKVYRTIDGSRVVVAVTFDTVENAEKHRAVLESPEMRPMAESIGIVYPMTIWIVEEV